MPFISKHQVMIIIFSIIAIVNISAVVFFAAVYHNHTKADKTVIEEYRMRA